MCSTLKLAQVQNFLQRQMYCLHLNFSLNLVIPSNTIRFLGLKIFIKFSQNISVTSFKFFPKIIERIHNLDCSLVYIKHSHGSWRSYDYLSCVEFSLYVNCRSVFAETATGGVLWKDSLKDILPLAQVFFCEFCKIFKNIFFTDHLRSTAFVFVALSNI